MPAIAEYMGSIASAFVAAEAEGAEAELFEALFLGAPAAPAPFEGGWHSPARGGCGHFHEAGECPASAAECAVHGCCEPCLGASCSC